MVLLFLLAMAGLRAEWRDLKEGLDPKAVEKFIGAPLMQTKARGGLLVTWTYDNGGYVLFENGLVRYWQAPRPKKK